MARTICLARIKPLRKRRVPIRDRYRVLVDVEYRAKTSKSGLLRHPTLKGVRADLMDALGENTQKRNHRHR